MPYVFLPEQPAIIDVRKNKSFLAFSESVSPSGWPVRIEGSSGTSRQSSLHMPSPLCSCAETTERLATAVGKLQRSCGLLQLVPLEEREWFQLLKQKLLPQLRDESFLVAAVVGGTNIGKSVIFNHLAGCKASGALQFANRRRQPSG